MTLRIVGGRLSGRRFGAAGKGTRPTSERVREAMMSALTARGAIDNAHTLDLFAGTGALGFEALSRGATHVVAVERDHKAVRTIERDAQSLGIAADISVLSLDLLGAPDTAARSLASRGPFGLVFVDAPYANIAHVPPLLAALDSASAFTDDALIVVEHGARDTFVPSEGLVERATYRYGDTSVTFVARGDP